jgi:hypothetical protein
MQNEKDVIAGLQRGDPAAVEAAVDTIWIMHYTAYSTQTYTTCNDANYTSSWCFVSSRCTNRIFHHSVVELYYSQTI